MATVFDALGAGETRTRTNLIIQPNNDFDDISAAAETVLTLNSTFPVLNEIKAVCYALNYSDLNITAEVK